jgi:hypothetical protein
MNKIVTVDQNLLSEEAGQKPAGPKADEPQNFYVRVLKRQRPTVIVSMALVMAIALIYLLTDRHASTSVIARSARGSAFRNQC